MGQQQGQGAEEHYDGEESMSKHTLGPWEWNKYGALLHEDEIVLGIDGGCRRCDYPNEANGRLIAAAPDLLKALQGLLDCAIYGFDMPNDNQFALNARAAIERAHGIGSD